MRAQIIRSFGEPDVFEAADLPTPEPRAGEVLVRIAATSVNPVDAKLRRSGPAIAPALPAVLGCDVAGTVEALGAGVTAFGVGDRVYGCAGGVAGVSGGAYAEFIAADARLLAPAPRGVTLREAAALPLVAITAWEGLVDRARVEPGQRVLVHGGTGGVGHVAIQIAKARGAVVHATVSSDAKAAAARRLGADETIDYREEDAASYVARLTGGEGYDVVFDATGGSDLATSFAAARIGGQVVTIVSQYAADLSPMHAGGLTLHVVFMLIPMLHGRGRERHGGILRAVAGLVEAGRLRPLLDQDVRVELAGVADAHRRLEAGAALGKLVVEIDPAAAQASGTPLPSTAAAA